MIVVQSTGKKLINGYCTLKKIWKKFDEDEDSFYELGISAEHLARDVYGLCGTLIHEMTHLQNLQLGIKDVSPNFVYHNKKFKLEAEKHGLIITQAPKIGWSVTELNEECKQFVDTLQIDPELFSYSRTLFIKQKVASNIKHYTYTCPLCNEKIGSTNPDLQVICSNCSDMDNQDSLVYFERNHK